MSRIQNDTMVDAVSPGATHEALGKGILPRRLRSGDDFLDTHRLDPGLECLAVNTVAVANEVLGGGIKRKSIHNLPACPLRCRRISDVDVQYFPAVARDDEEHEQQSKGSSGHGKEIAANNIFGVILQECPPGLRWGLGMSDHVLRHGRLIDREAEHQHLAMNSGRAPGRIFRRQAPDQVSDVPVDRGTAGRPPSTFPPPVPFKPLSMPTDHRLGFDDNERGTPLFPDLGEEHPKQSVAILQPGSLMFPRENSELLPEGQVFEEQAFSGFQDVENSTKRDSDNVEHEMISR